MLIVRQKEHCSCSTRHEHCFTSKGRRQEDASVTVSHNSHCRKEETLYSTEMPPLTTHCWKIDKWQQGRRQEDALDVAVLPLTAEKQRNRKGKKARR
jgi:hypothetical protein